MSLASAETSSGEELSNEPPAGIHSSDGATPNKRRDFSIGEKVELLIKYDSLPKMSQSKAARELGISKQLVCRILQQRADIMQAWLHNKDTHRKRRRCGKDGEVETALKEWFDSACAEGVTVTGPIMRKKAEELARNLGKTDFVATDGWFSRWRKRENIVLLGKPRGDQNASDIPAGQWPEMLAAYSAECVYGVESTSRERATDGQTSPPSPTRADSSSTPDATLLPVRGATQCLAKRRSLSISEKIEVLTKYDSIPVTSQREAASQLGVSQPMLSKILSTRHEIVQESLQNSARKRKRCGKDGKVEKALKLWFAQMQEEGVKLTGPMMKKKAEELAREMGREGFVATDGWFNRWRKRENIKTCKQTGSNESCPLWPQEEILVPAEQDSHGCGNVLRNHPIVGLADSNPSGKTSPIRPESSSEYFSVANPECDVKPVITSTTSDERVPTWYANPETETTSPLSSCPPERTYTIEISSVRYLLNPSFSEVGNFNLLEEKLSILCCVNLCGSKQKLLVVGQRACLRHVCQLPVDYYFNDEARVTPHIIFDWLMKWDRILDHEIVLMMDDCQDLSSITSFQHLKFLPIPEPLQSCGTSIFQVLLVRYFDLKRRRLEWLDDSDETVRSTDSIHRSSSFLSLLHLIAQAWQNVPIRTIRAHFIGCGLLTNLDDPSPNDFESCSNSTPIVKTEGCESLDFIVDCPDPASPANEDILKALSILTRAVYHRAEEFSKHYEYETFIQSIL